MNKSTSFQPVGSVVLSGIPLYGRYRRKIGEIACVDHIHMCVKIPPKYSVAQVMGYLKGKSSLMIFESFPHLRYILAIGISGAPVILSALWE